MENNKNRGIYIGAVIVFLLILGYWAMNKDNAPNPEENNVANEEVKDSTEDTSTGSVNVGKPATLSYQNAVNKYKDARIELDPTCQASPNQMTFKNGTEIMIDNRSSKDRTVKVGSIYNIKAWGFKIVKLTSATLPATWMVDCDQSQNVATILIQQ